MSCWQLLTIFFIGCGICMGCGKTINVPDVLPLANTDSAVTVKTANMSNVNMDNNMDNKGGNETPTYLLPDGKILLRYHFKKEEELRWNVQHTLKMKNIIGGMEENIETSSRSAKIWKAIESDKQSGAVFEYSVEDVDMRHSQSGRDDAAYNSRRDKEIPAEFINLEGKIGIPLAHIKIDHQGNTVKKTLREYDGRISENRIVIPLPQEAVPVGFSWSETKHVELPLPDRTVKRIKIMQQYTLEKIQSGLASIRFSSFSLSPITALEKSKIFENFSSGIMELDLEAGHFIRQESTIDEMVVGIQRESDSIRYLARMTECCCGRKNCDICGDSQ